MAQVRNVVLDMGGVLMDADLAQVARKLCPDEQDAALLTRAVFDSREWGWVDADAISEQTLAWSSKLKVPDRLHSLVDHLVEHWHDEGLFDPLPGADELVRSIKDAGFGTYLLSNAGPAFSAYRDRIPGIELFDGIVVSCYERVVKPDPRIYLLLCERYGLDPTDCLFVDDLRRNVVGAERVGMQGYLYDGDAAALRAFLCEA